MAWYSSEHHIIPATLPGEIQPIIVLSPPNRFIILVKIFIRTTRGRRAFALSKCDSNILWKKIYGREYIVFLAVSCSGFLTGTPPLVKDSCATWLAASTSYKSHFKR